MLFGEQLKLQRLNSRSDAPRIWSMWSAMKSVHPRGRVGHTVSAHRFSAIEYLTHLLTRTVPTSPGNLNLIPLGVIITSKIYGQHRFTTTGKCPRRFLCRLDLHRLRCVPADRAGNLCRRRRHVGRSSSTGERAANETRADGLSGLSHRLNRDN